MLTSLPLVSELHHPAMRPRHWTQLMRARLRLHVAHKHKLSSVRTLQ